MGRLAEPFAIKGMRLRNRLVMLPMVTNLATPEGFVTDALVAHYAERARQDAALVIVESTGIDPTGRNITQGVGIWDDAFVPGLRRLAAGIKAGGAAAAIQIFHAGAKTSSALPPVSASGLALRSGQRPRVLAEAEAAEDCRRLWGGGRSGSRRRSLTPSRSTLPTSTYCASFFRRSPTTVLTAMAETWPEERAWQ